MTEAATATEAALAKTGATPKDVDAGQTTQGAPKPPASGENNKPEPTEAEKAAQLAAAAAEENADNEEHSSGEADKSKAETEAENWRDEYLQFDDPSANAVVSLLKEAKVPVVTANAIFAEAIKLGDISKVDWKSLESLLGADKTLLAKNGVEQYWNGALAESRAIVTDTYTQLGDGDAAVGEQNWKTLKDWAQAAEKNDTTGNFKAKLNSYRKMIDLGGESRRLAVEQLKAAYDADPKTKGFGTGKITAGERTPASSGEPLSRAEYVRLLHDAQANRLAPHLVKQLHDRRRAGKAAGI